MTRDRLLTRRWGNRETQAGCSGACVISVSTRYRRTEEGDWRRHVSVSLGIFEAVTVVSLSHAGRSCRVGTQGGEDIEGADVKAWSGGGPSGAESVQRPDVGGSQQIKNSFFSLQPIGRIPPVHWMEDRNARCPSEHRDDVDAGISSMRCGKDYR